MQNSRLCVRDNKQTNNAHYSPDQWVVKNCKSCTATKQIHSKLHTIRYEVKLRLRNVGHLKDVDTSPTVDECRLAAPENFLNATILGSCVVANLIAW